MLSSDKNVETLARLIETLKDYIGLQKEYLKLDAVHKLVRLLAALLMGTIAFFTLLGVLFYISFAVAHLIAPTIGVVWAYAMVAAALLLLLLLIYALRRPLIINPLVRLLTSILLG